MGGVKTALACCSQFKLFVPLASRLYQTHFNYKYISIWFNMSQMLNYGSELIRINPSKECIEYSTNEGKSWHSRFRFSPSTGEFIDLCDNGSELLAITSIGLYYSTNRGQSWHQRCRNSLSTGDFIELYDNGKELLADTTKGLFYSTNSGRSWHLRKRK